MAERNLYLLIHSPLVGPLTWSLVAEEMRKRGLDILVPGLEDSPDSNDPYWKQHAESVARYFTGTSGEAGLVLVAHSGAGPLLPVIRRSIPNPVLAYVFVDAGIPRDGASRLDLMRIEDPEWAAEFQEELERGEHFPNWSMDDLQEVIPDESLRHKMAAELHPRWLDFFAEPIPVFGGWPDAPCIYIRFSPMYGRPAEQARQSGWQTYELDAGHFHMLVDPSAVADQIIEAVRKIRTP